VREWLVFIGTELHKNAGPLFNPKTPEAARMIALEALKRRLGYVNDALANRAFLTGESFSVADAYLFTILTWLPGLGVELVPWPNLQSYYERVRARPAVQTVLKAEGPSH
jgi:glutathione S-transferase